MLSFKFLFVVAVQAHADCREHVVLAKFFANTLVLKQIPEYYWLTQTKPPHQSFAYSSYFAKYFTNERSEIHRNGKFERESRCLYNFQSSNPAAFVDEGYLREAASDQFDD